MTHEQLQIQAAYGRVAKQLEDMRDKFLADALENPQDYEGITTSDAEIWFIEGFE